jgi:hypothetical protein
MKKENYQIPDTKNQLKIQFEVEDEKTNKIQILKFEHTNHSLYRSDQRGISKSKISITLEYGTTFFKQGFIYYVLSKKDIPNFLMRDKSHLKNTVVIVSGDTNQVITCYRSSNPLKKMKHKSKELYKNYKNVA